jgi:hypothetical protein
MNTEVTKKLISFMVIALITVLVTVVVGTGEPVTASKLASLGAPVAFSDGFKILGIAFTVVMLYLPVRVLLGVVYAIFFRN